MQGSGDPGAAMHDGRARAGGRWSAVSASEEAVLLGRVAAEDVDAFERLYRLYSPRLQRFVHGITKQPALVDEVLDDTMLVVWRKAYTFNHSSKVSTWILAIAYRQALKKLRRNGAPVDFETGELPEIASTAGPEDDLQQQELHEQLDAALATLSAEQRAVMELTYYFGYACREIAQIVGCPVDTVKTRMFHARRKLRIWLTARREVI